MRSTTCSCASCCGSRRASRAGVDRIADQPGRRRAAVGNVRSGGPPCADDEPRQRDGRSRARALGRSCRPRSRRRTRDVRLRAEDRRPGDEPALRERTVRAGGDPRRRPSRRGRDGQRGHDLGPAEATAAWCTRSRRGARRGVHADRQLRGAQRACGGGRAAAVRQPAQRRCGQPAAEGPACHRQPRAELLVLPARRGRRRARVHQPSRDARVPRRASASRSTPRSVSSTTSPRSSASPGIGRSIATTCRTRSTVRSPRSITWRSASCSASHRAPRAGRSPSSSRRRSAPPSSATSRCRSAAPGAPPRSPCSIRCSSADPRCAWPRCTTRIRSAPRTSGPATR